MKTANYTIFMAAGLAVWWVAVAAAAETGAPRRIVSLNGTWEIAEGSLASVPARFDRAVPVPGLVDMATPAFDSPGSTLEGDERRQFKKRPPDPRREAFWYRRTFRLDGPLPAVALLKVHKAMYGTLVLLNRQKIGEHGPNFTPGWFDLRAHLKSGGGENELIIRVGASLAQVPPYLTEGGDFEKRRYIPGIYDAVELILSGTPHVVNVQTVPDVGARAVRAVIEVAQAGTAGATCDLRGIVREAKSRDEVGAAVVRGVQVAAGATNKVELTVVMRDARLWSPEDPFLYELEVTTGADTSRTRFGLRSFGVDPVTRQLRLNGKPYFLRGSNVCIYRFFEDKERGALPWDPDWVRKLHRSFRGMHWNSLRYCIGFPPEMWYDIADEEGVLIQDEFPIWYGGAKDGWPADITPAHLAAEYTEWMRERWNHPCVAIWDAQNETTDDRVIAAAIGQVRSLDLSGRPWDNGWGAIPGPNDIAEFHPYRANRQGFTLAAFARESGMPDNGPRTGAVQPPYVINEYAWLWINRDGGLPTLTVDVYNRLLGAAATPEERFQLYARLLAAKTEFWRVRRLCAGVLHFCGLGYSRADGQTSDNFVDVKNLVFEANFARFVRDAFAPVGIAIDWWETDVAPGASVRVPVRVINDLATPWRGDVTLRLWQDGRELSAQTKSVNAAWWALGAGEFEVTFPGAPADCELVAELRDERGGPVQSHRLVRVSENLARQARAMASSEAGGEGAPFAATLATDGRPDTRWESANEAQQWLAVDLGAVKTVSRVRLQWPKAAVRAFGLEVSTDGETWKPVFTADKGQGGINEFRFAPVAARHVRVRDNRGKAPAVLAIAELEVYER